MKVVVTNVVSLNGGDAAILMGVVAVLRSVDPAVEIVVLDSQPEAASRLYPDIEFQQIALASRAGRAGRLAAKLRLSGVLDQVRRLRLTKAAQMNLQTFRSSDLIVSTGGTYLVEHYDLTTRLNQLDLAVASGRSVVLFTQSLGPFKKPANVRRLRKVLPRVDLVMLRDAQSAGNLAAAGIDGVNLAIHADAAFALADEGRLARARSRRWPDAGASVAISVRHWRHFQSGDASEKQERYASAIAGLTEWLIKQHGAEVTFLSTCQGVADYWTDDSKLAKAIEAMIDPALRPRVRVDDGFHTPEALMEKLSSFDAAVATRLHFAILSLCAGTPVLPIAYEFKTREVFRRLGLERKVVDIEAVSADQLIEGMDEFIRTVETNRSQLIDAVTAERADALAAKDPIRALLSGKSQ